MKTKIYIFSLLGTLLLTMGSCLSDGKEDYLNEYESFVGLRNSGEQEITLYRTGESVTYDIPINKGGKNLDMDVSAQLRVLDDYDVEYYNQENNTSYKRLPSDCYSLPADMSVSFGEKDLYVVKTITLDTEKIYHYTNNEPGKYALILELDKETSPVVEKNKYLILQPTVLSPSIVLGVSGFVSPFTIVEGQTEYEYTIPIELSTALPVDATCNVTIDEDALTEYNTSNGTNYQLVKNENDNYTVAPTVVFSAGKTVAELKVKVNISDLNGEYALPLVVSSDIYSIKGDNKVILGFNTLSKLNLTADMLALKGTDFAEGSFAEWLDEAGITTYGQVTYGAASLDNPFPHFIVVTLKNPVSSLKIRYATRNAANQIPKAFSIEVSNVAWNDTNYDNDCTGDWKRIKSFTADADELPMSTQAFYEKCPVMNLGGQYKYVRMRVTGTSHASFPTWGLSVFELYGR